MRIEPATRLSGELSVPGDKSISHRYALFGAMAEGQTAISNFSSSADCHSTLHCIEELGVQVNVEGCSVTIQSPGWQGLRAPSRQLDAGNSGTTIRMLSALLAAQPFETVIAGDASLNRRPMERIVTPLTRMGASIETAEGGLPPLKIRGGGLHGIRYDLPVASAQVKSCVLLAGLMAEGETTVVERIQTRDHTERALPIFGAPFRQNGTDLSVKGPSRLTGATVRVVGDVSSAIFFVVAALLVRDSSIMLQGIGANPSRTGLLELLLESGANIHRLETTVASGEPVSDLRVSYDPGLLARFPNVVEGDVIPNLIDEIPILAVLGTQLEQGLAVRDASELRKKESDRIHSVVSNLRNLGVMVEEFQDGFRIPGRQKIRGGQVKTYGDHRIAMAFAVAGLISEEGVSLDDPDCAAVSFPAFYKCLDSLHH